VNPNVGNIGVNAPLDQYEHLAPGMSKDPVDDSTESSLTSQTGCVQVNMVTAYKTVLNKVKFMRSSLSSDLSDQSEGMEKSWSYAEIIGTGIFYRAIPG
jgi:hypothetical protein